MTHITCVVLMMCGVLVSSCDADVRYTHVMSGCDSDTPTSSMLYVDMAHATDTFIGVTLHVDVDVDVDVDVRRTSCDMSCAWLLACSIMSCDGSAHVTYVDVMRVGVMMLMLLLCAAVYTHVHVSRASLTYTSTYVAITSTCVMSMGV